MLLAETTAIKFVDGGQYDLCTVMNCLELLQGHTLPITLLMGSYKVMAVDGDNTQSIYAINDMMKPS